MSTKKIDNREISKRELGGGAKLMSHCSEVSSYYPESIASAVQELFYTLTQFDVVSS